MKRLRNGIIAAAAAVMLILSAPAAASAATYTEYYSGTTSPNVVKKSGYWNLIGSRNLAGYGGMNATAVAALYASGGSWMGQAEATTAAAEFTTNGGAAWREARCWYRSPNTGINMVCKRIAP